MSDLRVTSLRGRKLGTVPTLPDGAVVTGVTTSTSFSGNVTGNVTGNVIGDSNITGTTGTFTGNVSVGGTLTYDDVTDIDSVGVVTARAGIKIGAGQSVSAVSGIVTYYGDGSKLSGVDHGVVNFVASGTIANGQTVVINTDGTVGIITQTTSNTPSAGTPVVFNAGNSTPNVAFDSTNNKVVVVYTDDGNSGHGTAIIGTVSGTSISFGSEVVFNAANTGSPMVAFVGSGKVVIGYKDDGNNQYGTAIVGTVSGNSISFGSEVVYRSSASFYNVPSYDSTNNKVVIGYMDNGNSNHGKAIVGTVSGTSISFGSEVTFNAGTSYSVLSTFVGSGKVVISYKDNSNSNAATAIVGTVSGTSISFGSEVTFDSAVNTSRTAQTFDTTNNKLVIAYNNSANINEGIAVVGTVSGTSISFGTPVIFNNANTSYPGITFDPDTGKVIITYKDGGNSNYGTAIQGTVSGTSISFGSEVVYESATVSWTSAAYDSHNDKVVIAYRDDGNSNYGTAVVFSATSQTTNLTAENYIGIAAEAISNGATGKINVVTGTNTGQTGLTTAQKYFVQPNGTLGTSAGSPSVVAGTAISDTKIVVR
ncbi:hypothetical protein OAA60_04445 [Porticoccaceae bacterium]|nr:hypothetical protein [Porticoccaceae bacterium]